MSMVMFVKIFIMESIQLIFLAVGVLLSVAFFSLFERKVLAIIQNRVGPDKVGIVGILQPFSDAMKLISKTESPSPSKKVGVLYFFSPAIMFVISFIVWITFPSNWEIYSFDKSMLFVIACMGSSVYGLVMTGWFSSSKYSLIGSVRAIGMSISYEIILVLGLVLMMFLLGTMSVKYIISFQEQMWLFFPLWFVFIILLISFLAESGRAPFDLSEGESELVSGYSVEYGGISYTLIFLSENSSIIFSSVILSSMFFAMGSILTLPGLIFLVVWIRGTVPRMRFDQLMMMCWVKILPIMLFIFGLVMILM
nr:NADH dehydrogenase subunit 1 [Bothriometopus macrocnemis]UTT72558.1 NADH dehydrogenase subunit 1 [Bothriometopus macrocnemis]